MPGAGATPLLSRPSRKPPAPSPFELDRQRKQSDERRGEMVRTTQYAVQPSPFR